jgi:succinyl-diaminopimelate desuccinylase
MGLDAEKHPVPEAEVQAAGLQSITNLVVRRRYGGRPDRALNAHGDVVPPGEGWTHDPYGGEIVPTASSTAARRREQVRFRHLHLRVRALEVPWARPRPAGCGVELHFTYDEEFGGEVGPGWLLKHRA